MKLVCLVIFTSGPQPAALAQPATAPSTIDTKPQPGNRFISQPDAVPEPLSGPTLTTIFDFFYDYVVRPYDNVGNLSPYSSEACGLLPLLDM